MRRALALALALVFSGSVCAAATDTAAQGPPDGKAPGWIIHTQAPAGWTADCCTYARAIGVNLVIYRGEWTGEPDRVMVLNVWPRKLASLQAELDADRKHYLERDPAAKVARFAVRQRDMPCEAQVFEGTDHVDDAVVFCDPCVAAGIRLSWSVSFKDADPQRAGLLEDFMRVVVASRYQRQGATPR